MKLDVEIRVIDSGIGISENERGKLFKTFSQADVSTTRKFGGSGLGLALSKTFARGLGGDLVLESSVPGVGSTFLLKFTLPTVDKKKTGHRNSHPLSPDQLKGLKVLLVEDSVDIQALVTWMLAKNGIEVDLASNGDQGVERALTGQYELILMDISMPDVDGYTAVKRLRAAGFTEPIIALTAHAFEDIRQKCLQSGFDDHVAKPIDFDCLLAKIASLTDREP